MTYIREVQLGKMESEKVRGGDTPNSETWNQLSSPVVF